jgi:DNA-directed RNA polymerase II subunit RPB2
MCFPHEARLRNLYSAPLYVDVELNQYRVNKEVNIQDPSEDLGEPIATENAKRSFGIRAHHVRSLFVS